MTDTEPMVSDAEAVRYELEQIARWEKEKDIEQLLRCAIVQGGVLERTACAALERLGKPSQEACLRTIDDAAAPPFHRFSAARVLGHL
ncbi:MAG: hypothetical protein FJ125_08690, partial [Deltaproteobacteria bacterium]|nr:hypothetical protein [Deltaproteobacteria bacterium]